MPDVSAPIRTFVFHTAPRLPVDVHSGNLGFLLQENGTFLLQENGFKIMLEGAMGTLRLHSPVRDLSILAGRSS